MGGLRTIFLVLVLVLVAPAATSAQPRVAVLIAPFSCGNGGASKCAEIGIPLPASFSSTCIHGALRPVYPVGGGHVIPTRHHGEMVRYTWSDQVSIGKVGMSWTVTWPSTLKAPFAGHGTGTWQASGLPSCASTSTGEATVTWRHVQGKLIATYTFGGLP